MKISQIIFASLLLCFFAVNFVYSQDNTKKDKPKNGKFTLQSVEVKANLLVLDASGKLADVKPEDLRVFEDGAAQKITYFAKKEVAVNVGILVDNSGSLRETFMDVLFAASTVVGNLKPDDEAFLIRFVSSDQINTVQDWTLDKRKLDAEVQNMFVEGGRTAIIDAVYLAAEKILEREKQAKSKRYALLLISDAVDADSYYDLNQLLGLVKNTDLQIFTFSFPGERAFKQAREARYDMKGGKDKKPLLLNNILAQETGGSAYTLPAKYTKAIIADALKKLVAELRSQYVIGYTSTNQKRSDKPRNLRVEIADTQTGEKRQGFVRENFVAPKDID